VLGIDPGSHRTGWGIVRSQGTRLRLVAAGTIETNGGMLGERLREIADTLDRVIGEHRPEAMAVESVFYARNAQSALLLGQARGVALLCAARQGVQIFEYTAGQIKQATTGRGRASKEQVQSMVRIVLGCRGEMGLDTSDALAAAICHAHMEASPTTKRLQGLTGSARPRRGAAERRR
jgi:crossover junction endodeoxyribonuclease RuvC